MLRSARQIARSFAVVLIICLTQMNPALSDDQRRQVELDHATSALDKAGAESEAREALKKMIPFKTEDGLFQLNYPANWTVMKYSRLWAPQTSFEAHDALGRFDARITLVKPISLDEWIKRDDALFSAQPGYVQTSQERITFDGAPAYKTVCSFDLPGKHQRLTALTVICVKNGRSYGFAGVTADVLYPALSEVFEKISQSIELRSDETQLRTAAPAKMDQVSGHLEFHGAIGDLLAKAEVSRALEKMIPFKTEDGSLQLNYPANWNLIKLSNPESLFMAQDPLGRIAVKVIKPIMPRSLDEFLKQTDAEFSSKPGYVKTSQKPITIDGAPGYQTVCSFDEAGVPRLTALTDIYVKNGWGCGFFAMTADDWYPVLSEVFEKISQSIELRSDENQLRTAALAKMDQFTSDDSSFKIEYPANWEVVKPEAPCILHLRTLGGGIAAKVTEKPTSGSLDDLVKNTAPKLTATQKMIQIHGGVPACKMTSSDADDGVKFKSFMVVAVKNNRCYIFVCTTTKECYRMVAPVFEKMTESIDLSGK